MALDAPHECLLILVSDAADARGRCPSTWTVQVSTWSSPVRLWLVVWVHGRERALLSHFSDSLAATSGFAVTSGANIGPHHRLRVAQFRW